MSMTYFIGGAPRSGKSTIIQKLVAQKPMFAASTDAIRSVAMGALTPEINPSLFKVARGRFASPQHLETLEHRQNEVLTHEIGYLWATHPKGKIMTLQAISDKTLTPALFML